MLKLSRYYSLKSELREEIERCIYTDDKIITLDKFKNLINENKLYKTHINSIQFQKVFSENAKYFFPVLKIIWAIEFKYLKT